MSFKHSQREIVLFRFVLRCDFRLSSRDRFVIVYLLRSAYYKIFLCSELWLIALNTHSHQAHIPRKRFLSGWSETVGIH